MSKITTEKPRLWHRYLKDLLFGKQQPHIRFESATRSIVGGRNHNEDRCYRNDQDEFYMVADGMGGYKGGGLASQIAIEIVPDFMQDFVACGIENEKLLTHAFQSAVQSAQHEMAKVAADHSDYGRMGCTIASGFVIGDQFHFANIGDCRIYLHRGQELKQLTRDQSMVQDLVDAQVITTAQATTHRLRHLVTNSVSAHGVRSLPSLGKVRLGRHDTLLLTTDGLVNELSDAEICDVLEQSETPTDAVDLLTRIAAEREAHDNVSCVVLRRREGVDRGGHR